MSTMRTTRCTFLSAAVVAFVTGYAQPYSIAEPELTICSGLVEDTGGAGATYGNNESFTTTICPDAEGTYTSLNFLLFNLDTEGATPGDVLHIYDGTTTSAPLMGTYSGTQLQGLVVTASALNTSGCLTLTFTSNDTGTGDFAMAVSCSQPCVAPMALWAASMPDTVALCQGGQLVLDGSASLPAPGRTITRYIWHTGSAVPDSTSGPVQPVVLMDGGPAPLWLQVVDDLGCPSEASDVILALVAPTPSFLGTMAPLFVCVPDTINLAGQATLPPFVNVSTPCQHYGSGAFLPDDIAIPFESQLIMGAGVPGQLITTAADMGDICLEIEHSYMGDLLVEVFCPNGQSVTLHQQGGGGTYLGEAIDFDSNAFPQPGTCWNYCFNTDPDNGTWAECSQNGITPNVVPVPGGLALAPGSYTPIGSLDDLIGCPVNGSWTLRITDLAGSDNGFLCSWCTGFPSEVDSSTIALSPTLALDATDSAYWSGPQVVNDPFAPTALVNVDGAAMLGYTFTVVDSYGCVHDTTVVVNAMAPTVVDAGPDVTICADSVLLNVAVLNGLSDTCNYVLTMFDLWGDSWSGASVGLVLNGDTSVYFHLSGMETTVSIPMAHGATIALFYTPGSAFNLENRFDLVDPAGNLVYGSPQGPAAGTAYTGVADCSGLIPAFGTVQWTPATGLSNASSLIPSLFTTTSGWYSVTVVPADLPACAGTDSLWVEAGAQPLDLTWDADENTLCASVDTLFSFAWWLNGELQTTTTANCLADPAVGLWTVSGTGFAECPYISNAVLVCPILTVEQNGGFLVAIGATGMWEWTIDGVPLPDATGAIINVQGNGTYIATVTTAIGCVLTDSLVVDGLNSVDEQADGRNLRAFPTPNNGDFTVLAEGLLGPVVILRLTDMTGRAVYTTTMSTANGSLRTTLELDCPAGSYLLTVRDAYGERMLRVVIQ